MVSRRARTLILTSSGALSLVLLLGPRAGRVAAQTAGPSPAVHVVTAGETLSDIALDVGAEVAVLQSLNGLDDPDLLSIGQQLKLPAAAGTRSAPSDTAPAATSTYVIVEGDTLWSIAQRFSTSTADLVARNNLDDPNRVVAGTSLSVPAVGAPPAPRPASPPLAPAPAAPGPAAPLVGPRRSLLVTYTVQPGETLTAIARQFGVRTDAIAQASELADPNRLASGMVLKVPQPGREHVVQAGETLRDIAQAEKVDLGALIDFNALEDPRLIRIGQVVLIPAAATTGSTAQASASNQPPTVAAVPSAPHPAPAPPQPSASPSPAPPRKPTVVATLPRTAPTDGLAGAALKFLGSAYVWGGSSPAGFDCSGFIWYVSRNFGKPLSRGLYGQYNSGAHPNRDALKVGDLVFFQNTYTPGLSHNGIYIGNNLFVHAVDESAGVTISSLTTAYWSSHWFGATRLP